MANGKIYQTSKWTKITNYTLNQKVVNQGTWRIYYNDNMLCCEIDSLMLNTQLVAAEAIVTWDAIDSYQVAWGLICCDSFGNPYLGRVQTNAILGWGSWPVNKELFIHAYCIRL